MSPVQTNESLQYVKDRRTIHNNTITIIFCRPGGRNIEKETGGHAPVTNKGKVIVLDGSRPINKLTAAAAARHAYLSAANTQILCCILLIGGPTNFRSARVFTHRRRRSFIEKQTYYYFFFFPSVYNNNNKHYAESINLELLI